MSGAPGSPPLARFGRRLRRDRRQWAVDAAVAVLGFAVGLLLLLATMSDDPVVRENVPAQVTAGAVAAVAMLVFRRTHPIALAVAGILTGFVAVPVSGLAVAAFFGVAVHRPARTALIVTGAHAALVLVLFQIGGTSPSDYWQGVGTFLFLDAVALTTGMLVRSQRLLVASWEDRARQAENEQRLRVDEARHQERERIAREMHDVLAHRVSLLAVHAGALEFRAGASAEEARAAGVIRQCAHDALEDLREVIRMLRTESVSAADDRRHAADADDGSADRPQPTLADLPALIGQSRRAGASVELVIDGRAEPSATPVGAATGDPAVAAGGAPEHRPFGAEADGHPETRLLPDVPDRLGRHAYRIVQEGLTNARKHAPGEPVSVRVDTAGAAGLRVEIVNPLRSGPLATPPIPGSGAGLIGLRERVSLVGGTLEHGRDNGEFRLRAWLPWSP
ncbi:histidine kinase [Yinghuangia sp. ASG 101]|uniref:sensor histidine kinase n=1 Tax=Yinghuangia sp. ASG 101 TaxID=2896848 RepID=UPI001E2D12D0|nr:histidine kinase [Yinghuangia sp. ASG 101]UGQ10334.1 histidine kinase [Yinghuangia sp. ASG 101]